MKFKHSRRVALALILALSVATRTYALFGLGDIVFDPSNYEQAIQQLLQMERQYQQLVQTYQILQSQYEQLKWMAKQVPVNMAARYRAAVTPWKASSAADTYGTAGSWTAGINTGTSVRRGYSQATEELRTYGETIKDIPADQLERIKTAYGTVELTDGANLNAMATVGSLRANASAVEFAIQGLEDDSLSADPRMNTEVALLNKINAAAVLSLRTAQDANKLLVALTEQQILEAKRTRDAEARALNQHIRFRTEGHAILIAQAAGASQAMRDWRMP
ncbi:MAG TPA: hypothetical protein VHI99_05500 [Vicinamibacterales bacterium]|jgi:hypothetical protein|nr:hypothetical protein [Vicinamibacterales bacterium]